MLFQARSKVSPNRNYQRWASFDSSFARAKAGWRRRTFSGERSYNNVGRRGSYWTFNFSNDIETRITSFYLGGAPLYSLVLLTMSG